MRKKSGVIGFTATQEKPSAQGGRPLTVYNVNKRDSYIVVAQLSPEFTAQIWTVQNTSIVATLEGQ
jgi:phage regulator Rha-like protein